MVCDLGRQRRLDFTERSLREIPSRFSLVDLRKYLARVHAKNSWGTKEKETQSDATFRFNPRLFEAYVRKVLKREVRKIYFPLVYTGKVAKALADHGYDVLASDLSSHWVQNARSLGLRAEQRSFEQFPEENFDAVVSFEPYPILDKIEGYLGLLQILSKRLPIVFIFDIGDFDFTQMALVHTKELIILKVTLDNGTMWYPLNEKSMTRIGYDYGANYSEHKVIMGNNGAEFKLLDPTEVATRNATIDLQVLEHLQQDPEITIASISQIAKAIGREVEEAAGSILRLFEVFNFRFDVYALSTIIKSTIIKSTLGKTSLHGAVKEIIVTE